MSHPADAGSLCRPVFATPHPPSSGLRAKPLGPRFRDRYVCYRTDDTPGAAHHRHTMTWSTYVPSSSTLVILFKIARARLMASSHNVALLSDARLISATEEMNKISDDIGAGEQAARWRTEEANTGRIRWSSNAEQPIPDLTILAKVAAWANLRHAVNTGTEGPHPQPRSLA